jgi:hypothetical protein
VADLNIAHFKKLLAAETDPVKRIEHLLAEPEAKLARGVCGLSTTSERNLAAPPWAPMSRIDQDALTGRDLDPAIR